MNPSGSTIINFVRDDLISHILRPSVLPKLNALEMFSSHLVASGCSPLRADEFSRAHATHIADGINRECEDWQALGLPAPMALQDQKVTLVTWAHQKFESITGRTPASVQFVEMYEWLKDQQGANFLLPCACFLMTCGCDRVFVTDGSGDGGVDLLGVVDRGPFESVCIVVQAKSSTGPLRREALLAEYSKFFLLTNTGDWHRYARDSGIERAPHGVGLLYIFASNNEFRDSTRQAARGLRIMLRSGRQIAHQLSSAIDATTIKRAASTLGPLAAASTVDLCPSLNAQCNGLLARNRKA